MLYAGRPFRVRRILVAVSGDLWNRWNCDNPDLDPRESTPDLYAALKHHWGYDSFRPMQERIVQSLLGGSDVAVIMPIGGGKSLCYQLPALALARTVVVISPLIALMQDQVAQLGDMGIPTALSLIGLLTPAPPADSASPPEVTHCSSVPCRPQTPWCGG